jgi:hypothetical protein
MPPSYIGQVNLSPRNWQVSDSTIQWWNKDFHHARHSYERHVGASSSFGFWKPQALFILASWELLDIIFWTFQKPKSSHNLAFGRFQN